MTAGWSADGVTVTVEVAFSTSDPLTTSPSWTDITAYVRSIQTRRGRWSANTRKVDAGTCTIVLDNSDRRFDPTHTGGAYYPNVLPMKQIRVSAVYSATTYRLFRGFVDGWPQTYRKGNPLGLGADAETTLTATDAFGYIATHNIPDRYALEVLTDDAVGYWRCGDPGNEMFDHSVNGNNGSWSGNTAQIPSLIESSSDGARSMGLQQGPFQLETTWDQSTGNATADILTTDDISLECWVYVGQVGASGGVQYSGAAYSNQSAAFTFTPILDINSSTTTGIQMVAEVESAAGDGYFVTTRLEADRAHHVVLTFTNSTTTLRLYVDGALSDSTSSITSFTGLTLLADLFIHNSAQDVEANDGRVFLIDEVAVYDSVLSAARIQAHYAAGATGTLWEQSHTRIEAILDYLDWPSALLETTTVSDSWLDGGPDPGGALESLQAINDTEQGRFHVRGDGVIEFFKRCLRTTNFIVSQGTFGDSGSELRYDDLALSGGSVDELVNYIEASPRSGVAGTVLGATSTPIVSTVFGAAQNEEQQTFGTAVSVTRPTAVARDTASIAAYGKRSMSFQTLHRNQGDATNLGLWLLSQYSDPRVVVQQMRIKPRRSPSTLFPQALGRVFGDLVTVKRRPQNVGSAISQDRWVEGIEHSITPDDWTTVFFLDAPVDRTLHEAGSTTANTTTIAHY